jgi:hypothetical protein
MTLPSTLAELSTYPIPFRNVLVAFVRPETRLSLWRQHLETFLVAGTSLTADQQTFVRESGVEMSPWAPC